MSYDRAFKQTENNTLYVDIDIQIICTLGLDNTWCSTSLFQKCLNLYREFSFVGNISCFFSWTFKKDIFEFRLNSDWPVYIQSKSVLPPDSVIL